MLYIHLVEFLIHKIFLILTTRLELISLIAHAMNLGSRYLGNLKERAKAQHCVDNISFVSTHFSPIHCRGLAVIETF